ncbi:MAG: hypothetical protein IID32_05375 [Planctomycetes bacterium]|nr:hypothetical protein [Planctomycetota bacterium]
MMKDSPNQMLWSGGVLPIGLLMVVAYNLISGKVHCLGGRGVFMAEYSDIWRFGGVILLKVSVATILSGWYGLANLARTEHLAVPMVTAGITGAVIGLALFAVGFFV